MFNLCKTFLNKTVLNFKILSWDKTGMIYPWQIKFSDKEGQKIYISLTISWSKYPYLLYL